MRGIGLHYPRTPCQLCDTNTDPEACPGECNRAWISAEKVAFDEAKSRRPRLELINHGIPMTPAEPVWCRPCQEHIAEVIAGLPDQCRDLTPGPLNTGRDTNTGTHQVSVIPPTPSPAWDQADEIIRWAVNTEDQLRAHIGDFGRGPRPWRDLGSAVSYLTLHATPLLSCPDAVTIGFDATRLSRHLTQVTGQDRLIHRLPGACLICKQSTLQRKDGDDLVRCRSCGGTWAWEYYEFMAKAMVYGESIRCEDAARRLAAAIRK